MALCNWAKFRLPPVSVVVTLPAEIDLYSRQQVYDRLCGACVSGAPVVIADFTSTRHCDTESMRRLLAAHEFAAASTAQLRFAIPPGSPVRRALDSLDQIAAYRFTTAWVRNYPAVPASVTPNAVGRNGGRAAGSLPRSVPKDFHNERGRLSASLPVQALAGTDT